MSATISVLDSFDGADGKYPNASLIADAKGNLFGTTGSGGANNDGSVFEIAYNATTGYATTPTVLVSFNGTDGIALEGNLYADANGDLFGTTEFGGANGYGTVFEISYSPQTGYASTPTVLASFGTGALPRSGLVADAEGDLFGVTGEDGANGDGTVFEIVKNADGSFASTATVLASFNGADGKFPVGGLMIDAAGDLIGTTDEGGANGNGTAFEIDKYSSVYASTPTVLANFDTTTEGLFSSLVADANGDLFGTSADGGAYAGGAVFEIAKNADGSYASTATVLASFNGPVAHSAPELNTDGSYPVGTLIIDAVGDLYGTTEYGGAIGDGTAFEIVKSASGYATTPTMLYSFNGSDGSGTLPVGGLLGDANGDLLGTTELGGAGNAGTVYEFPEAGFLEAGTGPEEFTRQVAVASGPLTGAFLWSNAANWTDGVPFDNDSAISHSQGIDDVAALSLFELDLLAGGTVAAVQNLTIDSLIGDQTTTVFANTTVPGSAASVTVTIGAFTATAGDYGAVGAGAVFDDEAATSPGAALYTASDDGKVVVAHDLTIGDATAGELTVTTGGQLTSVNGNIVIGSATVDGSGSSWNMSGALTIGTQDGTAAPSLTISDDASVTTSTADTNEDQLLDGSLTLATGGELTEVELSLLNAATLTVESGAVLTETASTPTPSFVGLVGNGDIVLNDGTLASANEYTEIGGKRGDVAGDGTITVSNGAVATNLATYLGYHSGDTGTLTVSGAGTNWTDVYGSQIDDNNAGINVGRDGNGSLTVEAGATLTNPLSYVKVAQFEGSYGTILVTGSGSMLNAGGLLRVGDSGSGAMTVQDDATVSVGQVQIGDYNQSVGTLDIYSGASLTTNSASTVDVGPQKIADPGTIDVAAGSFDIGVQTGSSGYVYINDGALTVQGNIMIGDSGYGLLSVVGNSVVSATDVYVGSPTGVGFFTLGGTLEAASFVVVSGHGGVNLAGGVLDPPQVTIDAGGIVSGYGTVEGSLENSGSITASGGTLDITGDITGAGMLTFASAAALELDGAVANTATIAFTGISQSLILGQHADIETTISGLGAGDSVLLAGQSIASAIYTAGSGQLAISGSGGAVFDLTLSGAHQQSNFAVTDGEVTVACFLRGTHLATADGDTRVEDLAVGDAVRAQFSGRATIKWIGHRHIDCRRHADPRKVWPVRVRADAFGDGQPFRDLWLSPDHAVLVDGVLIPVQYLINNRSITQEARDEVTYFHVELQLHDAVFAEGLACESYLDTGNRSDFAGEGAAIALHPDFSAWTWEALGCAPLLVTGSVVEAVQRRLHARADGGHGARQRQAA